MRFIRTAFLATTILSAGGSLAQANVKVVTSVSYTHLTLPTTSRV